MCIRDRAMLQDQVLGSKFNTDIRKFSRSYESSWYLNEYGIGMCLIFSIDKVRQQCVISSITLLKSVIG